MANYTWLGDLCGPVGVVTISKNSFDGLVGSLFDGVNMYSGKLIHDAAVAAPITCDFPGNTYVTSLELVGGTYDRYSYVREHDFNILCIPGVEVRTNSEQDQEYVYNGTGGTKAGAVFSQIIEAIPDEPVVFSFNYTAGCSEEDLEYNALEVEILAGGTSPIPAIIQDWIVEAISYYTSLRSSGMIYNQYTYMHPCVTEMKDNFFAAYTNLQDGSAGHLSLFKFDFTTNTATEVDVLALGAFHCGTSNSHAVSNQYLVWDETGSRLFLGDMMYTGSKPNQGQILVYDVDLGAETLTYSSTIANPTPSRYGYFGGCIAVDGGPNGSGQLIVGDVATMAYYFFDPVTLAEIPAHKILITKSNIGSVVAAYNGILWYQSPDGLLPDKIQTVQLRWNGSLWVEEGASVNDANDATGFVTAVSVTKFSCPSGLTKRPFMHCVNGSNQGYNGPYSETSVYNNQSITASKIYGATDSGGGFSFGAYYESYNIKRYDPNSGLRWFDIGSFDDTFVTNGNSLGYGYMLPISVNDPLDPDVWRILDMYNDTTPYDIKYDVIDTGIGDVLGYPEGNFFLKHTIDISIWGSINSASQSSGAGSDDTVRWVISTDDGATWHTVQSAGGGLVQLSSFEDGYINGGLMATFVTDLDVVPVYAASELIIGFLLIGGSTSKTFPYIQSISINHNLILGDPEFVLNHSNSGFNSKIEAAVLTSGTDQNWIYATVVAPITVDNCTLVMSQKTTDYNSLYGT